MGHDLGKNMGRPGYANRGKSPDTPYPAPQMIEEIKAHKTEDKAGNALGAKQKALVWGR